MPPIPGMPKPMPTGQSVETQLALLHQGQQSHAEMDAVQFNSLTSDVEDVKVQQHKMAEAYTNGIQRVHERVDSISTSVTTIVTEMKDLPSKIQSAVNERSQKDRLWQYAKGVGILCFIIVVMLDHFVFKKG